MKTLHLAIIVILFIITFFNTNYAFAQYQYCCLQEEPPPTFTVSTNLENYTTTDKIMITAHVPNPDNNTSLVIKILGPSYNLVDLHTFNPNSNETGYSWTVLPNGPLFYNSGNYTVTAKYGQNDAATSFYLHSTQNGIVMENPSSPLQQFKSGIKAQDVKCNQGLQLVIKAEDGSPACAKPETATKIIQRGWALDTTSSAPFIRKMWMSGLQQNYTVGQPINATVNYAGYYWYTELDVKIFDANGTQIWFNCPFCYTRTEAVPSLSFGTFTYHVRDYSSNNLPVINKTGTFTMVASLENKTAEAKFDIIPAISVQRNTGTLDIGNQTFYFITINDTLSSYHGVAAIPITFENVNFTLFPSVFSAGPPGSCGDTNFGSEVKFSDGTYERLGAHIPGSPCIENYTETVLSNHKNPQAGLEDLHGKITLLVSEANQAGSAEPTSCDMPYSQKPSYQSPLYSNGTILHTDYTMVFYMPMNSTGKMCVHYSNPNFQAPTGIAVFPANDLMKQANITTLANPGVIKTGNSTIVYTIKTGNIAGFYGISLFCGGMPFAVGYDNQSRIVSGDFPWLGQTFECPALTYSFDITGLGGIGIYYIATVSHEQLDYDITSTTVSSTHPNANIQNVTFSVHIRTFAKPANFWFDYKDSTISEFNSNPAFKQTTDLCNWEPAYHNSVGNFPWLGVTQINDNPVTIPPLSNGTYTFSILAKNLPSGYYGFNPVFYGKTTDLPPERAGTNYIAYDYPITIGVGHIMDPSGICSR
jgi:hypothetical protein